MMGDISRRQAMSVIGVGAFTPALPVHALTAARDTANVVGLIDGYNPVWTSQSTGSVDSMPYGGGDIGINVWVEKGDLLFYLSRSGAFSESNAYLKLGRMRVSLAPNPFADNLPFRQELKLREGLIEITGGAPGGEVRIRLWVAIDVPVVRVEIDSNADVAATVTYENWRVEDKPYPANEVGMHRSYDDAPVVPISYADRTDFHRSSVLSFHRNRDTGTVFDLLVEQQQLTAVKDRLWNPLKNLTFGVLVRGDGLVPAGTVTGQYASTPFTGWRLRSVRPARRHAADIICHIAHVPSPAAWIEGVEAIASRSKRELGAWRRRARAWWAAFWDRSHIVVNQGKGPGDAGWRVGRNYQLFRHQLGTNAYGAYPTKFNGGNFTTDPEYSSPKQLGSPDFRRWGGGIFTAQNQRLVYWPMLKSGDFDIMPSQFDFYERARGNAEIRSEVYWKIKGASFTEQMESFGLPAGYEYGWRRYSGQAGSKARGIEDNAWVDREWETVLEFCLMILDLEAFAGSDISRYLPLIESSLTFFDEYFTQRTRLMRGAPVNEHGHLVFFPGSALETYKNTLNSVVTISGLQTVITALLALPPRYLSAERRAYYQGFLKRLPPIPMRRMQGKLTIAPAEVFDRIQNIEIPQLYPVFPYRQYGLGRPDLQRAIDTWRHGVDNENQRGTISWHQDAIFCARLGLTDEAKSLTVRKLDDSPRRYPTFWGPGHDWVPDHNWGGSGMIGLQEMLMQTVDEKIYVFPAWPRDWDVDFRLHAPGRTVVEGSLVGGRVTRLRIVHGTRDRIVLPEWAGSVAIAAG